jgi:chromosome segregation ATPase
VAPGRHLAAHPAPRRSGPDLPREAPQNDRALRRQAGDLLDLRGRITAAQLAGRTPGSQASARLHTGLDKVNAALDRAPALHAEEAELRAALRDANQKITTLNGRLDALAAVTANLYRENQALRAALGLRTQIAPLPGKEPD